MQRLLGDVPEISSWAHFRCFPCLRLFTVGLHWRLNSSKHSELRKLGALHRICKTAHDLIISHL